MDNISFSKYLNNLFNKTGYLDKYGGSFIVTAIITFVFFIVFSYFYIMSQMEPIKKDWENQKCHPAVIPFAGIIKNPHDQSKFEFTSENFAFCTNKILSEIIGYFLQPIYFSSDLLNGLFKQIINSSQNIRKLFAFVRKQFEKIIEHIINKVVNIVIPLQKILIKLKDSLAKSVGVLTSVVYTAMVSFIALKSFFKSFLTIIIAALVIFAAAIVAMWILPFTWPVAAASTVLFLAVSIPMGIIAGWMGHILNLSSRSIPAKPGKPSCFDENTIIKTKNGPVKIKNLKKSSILDNDSIVTSVFKLKLNNQNMYNINNIIVSGSHKIFHKNLGWVFVKDHPDAIVIENYNKPFIYCFNTDTKRIKINNETFLDWDELEPIDIIKLKNLNFLQNNSSLKDIHKFLESGFIGNSKISLNDGSYKPINKIKINDTLKNNNKILGIVKIDTKFINNIYKFTLKNKEFFGSSNLNINDPNLGIISTLFNKGAISKKPKVLYHLITENGLLYVNNIRFGDYNTGIENIIDLRDKIFSH